MIILLKKLEEITIMPIHPNNVKAQFIREDAAPVSSGIWFSIILVVCGRIKLPKNDAGINP